MDKPPIEADRVETLMGGGEILKLVAATKILLVTTFGSNLSTIKFGYATLISGETNIESETFSKMGRR